jgi:hypothetical protein
LIFLVATAERDVCGAAEGIFDGPEVEQGFRDLLDAMSLIRQQ